MILRLKKLFRKQKSRFKNSILLRGMKSRKISSEGGRLLLRVSLVGRRNGRTQIFQNKINLCDTMSQENNFETILITKKIKLRSATLCSTLLL